MLKYVNFDIVFQEIPDEVTLAINLSNCPNGCPGCHSPFLQKDIGEPLTEEALTVLLRTYGRSVTCVCLMGGDASPDEIVRLAAFLQTQTIAPVKVGWYSGRQTLPPSFAPAHFHYVKLGPYIERLGPLKLKTTNQRLYRLDENGQMTDITSRFWARG
jgi:anaerobic ribonucleoside-triphosphate reductase activating protein